MVRSHRVRMLIVLVFAVFAVFSANSAGAQCATPNITATPNPIAPGGTLTLAWSPPSAACSTPTQPNFVGYEVWMSPPGGSPAVKLADLPTGQRTYNHVTGGPGPYGFFVRAVYTNAVCGACIFTYVQSNTVNVSVQTICTYSIAPTSANSSAAGSAGTVTVTAPGGSTPPCNWTATSNSSFITVTAGASGSGNGTVSYTVAANPTSSPARSGTLTIAGMTFTINQAAGPAPVCTYAILPTSVSSSAAGGPATVGVTAGAGCAWTAASNSSFIAITGGTPGSGNGTVNYTVAANPTSSPARSGTLSVAGQTFTVNQAAGPAPACTYSILPTSASSPAGGGPGTVGVTADAGCGWTAASSSSFITVTGGASGTGNGAVSYTVAANPGGSAARSGTLTVAGQTFTVTQAAGPGVPCSYTIAPTSSSIAAAGGPGNITVTAGSGCAWTAASNASFITVTGGASGSGNGTVSYSVAASTGAARSGTITVAGLTFAVNQASGAISCSYSIAPTFRSIAMGGGSGSVSVTTAPGCAWFAGSNASFLSVTSAIGGSGNGTVTYSVSPNSGSPRTGTLTIAGITFTVTQAGDCTYALDPDSAAVPAGGGQGSFTVNTTASCSWVAVSTDPFITINTGSGTGSGVVTFSVNNNIGGAREATITVGNSAFTIRQFANSNVPNSRRRRAIRRGTP